jgi:glycosyl hydrolase family 26
MGKSAVLLLTVVVAILLTFGGVALAQPATTPSDDNQRNAEDRATSGRDNVDEIENRGPPESKLPSKPSWEEPVSGQDETTSPALAQEATTTQTSEQRTNGAFVGPDVWADPAMKITDFTRMVGRAPHVIMYYQNWEQPEKKYFDPAKMQTVVDKGAMPMVTWAPRDPALGKKQPKYALKTIVAGNHDSYIRQWAKDAAAWGKSCQAQRQLASPCTMYLRFAHEMNGTWFPWSPGFNGNTAQEFRGAWKRIHGIFAQEGATNVRWVCSPYINCSGCSSFSSVCPGNTYVDWVALDGYN